METIAHGITELIGSTPMLEPVRFTRACGLQAQLFVKLEGFNPVSYTHLDVYKRQVTRRDALQNMFFTVMSAKEIHYFLRIILGINCFNSCM